MKSLFVESFSSVPGSQRPALENCLDITNTTGCNVFTFAGILGMWFFFFYNSFIEI